MGIEGEMQLFWLHKKTEDNIGEVQKHIVNDLLSFKLYDSMHDK